WMRQLVEQYGVRAVISKGGMPEEVYRELGDAFGVVFLSTVGYGLGAIYGRAVKRVRAVHWKDQLGISEAMWVLECEGLGPLLAALHAHRANPQLRIVLASKGLVGKSGCTRMVQGGYNAVLDPADSLELHLGDTLKGGGYLNDQELAHTLVEGAPRLIRELET